MQYDRNRTRSGTPFKHPGTRGPAPRCPLSKRSSEHPTPRRRGTIRRAPFPNQVSPCSRVKIAYANSLQRCLLLPHFHSGLVWCREEQYTMELHMANFDLGPLGLTGGQCR